jgi:hypothetical protein
MAYEYKTLTLCTDIDEEDVFSGTSSNTGYKLDWALKSTTDYIPEALSTMPDNVRWDIPSHSLSFVDNRCIFSILLKRNRK